MAALARVVAAEALDLLPPASRAARRSRHDLRRVHLAMGSRGIVVRGWQSLVGAGRAAGPLRILELGAGDGSLLLGVARALAPAWPQVQLTLLDRHAVVSAATLAAYARLGWQVQLEVADVLDWAAHAGGSAGHAPQARHARWDLVTTTLFLHHFQGPQLAAVLAAAAQRADRFFACEPRRHGLTLAASHLVGALGAGAVTRQDAVLSVRAGFRARELSAAWPGGRRTWSTHEYAAGLFSHCFSAHRSGAT
ncbi:MAG: class I SAM-dependent methyltransferase [Burkholderiales bacterium]|nr:class I SAM-dependent methyltransferase [Burkholderiales bacterium]MDE2274972.1 class I SAM-dependent methyltransferase [Burkholderiales bacterium]